MIPTMHPLALSTPFHPTVLDLNCLHHLHLNTEPNMDMDTDTDFDIYNLDNDGGFPSFPPIRAFSGEPSTKPTPPKPPTPPPHPRPGPLAPRPPPNNPTPPSTP